MLLILGSMKELDYSALAQVYAESLINCGHMDYPALPLGQQLQRAEQDFATYLREDFFPGGGQYAVWQKAGKYVSALRLLPHQDGLLVAGLETAPDARNRGYAKALLEGVRQSVAVPLYSHVDKKNGPSLAVHLGCGFRKISDSAKLLDGSVSHRICTLCCKK